VHYVGFDAPEGVLVGYGLDYAGRYRNLRGAALLAPHVYAGRPGPMDGQSTRRSRADRAEAVAVG
jgi:hypothetical protein